MHILALITRLPNGDIEQKSWIITEDEYQRIITCLPQQARTILMPYDVTLTVDTSGVVVIDQNS